MRSGQCVERDVASKQRDRRQHKSAGELKAAPASSQTGRSRRQHQNSHSVDHQDGRRRYKRWTIDAMGRHRTERYTCSTC